MCIKVMYHYRGWVRGARNPHDKIGWWPASLALALFILNCTSAIAAETILKDINIAARDHDTHITIDLGVPLEYVKHFPQSFGEIIQVQLKLAVERSREIHKEVRQGDELKSPPGRDPLLIYVTYEEGVPGGPYLTLRFVKPVRFRVEPQPSPTKLAIIILDEAQQEAKLPDLDQSAQSGATVPAAPTDEQESDLGELMAKARQALTFGDNEGAIRLLRKIIAVSGNPHEQDARELLGLALERGNQIPRAKFEYKKYLELYKEGAGPVRVQQRLTALENIGGVERREKLRVAKRARKVEEWKLFGRWSQDYSVRLEEQYYDDPQDDGQTILGTVVQSQRASTHASLRSRYHSSDRVVQGVFIGSHNKDFENNDYTEARLSDLYLDWDEVRWGLTGVLGRQRARSSGVYDRYDGVDVGYRVVDGVTPHLLAGRTAQYYDTDYEKIFAAARTELGKRKAQLTGNVFLVTQVVESNGQVAQINETDASNLDRYALGGDFRYNAKEHNFFGGLDYDVYFNEVNLLNLRWGWQFGEKSRLNLAYDFRRLLMYTNALSGLLVQNGNFNRPLTFDEFMEIFTEERGKELAANRTSESESITIGHTYQFTPKKQLNTDLSIYRSAPTEAFVFTADEIADYQLITGSTIALENHKGYDGTTSYNLTTQFIANDVFAPQDLQIVGFRYNRFSNTFDDFVFFYNGRLSPWYNWNPRPRFNIGYRLSKGAENYVQANRLQISPSIKLDRRWRTAWVFEFELGYDAFLYDDESQNDQHNYFFRLGYHYTF